MHPEVEQIIDEAVKKAFEPIPSEFYEAVGRANTSDEQISDLALCAVLEAELLDPISARAMCDRIAVKMEAV